MRFLLDEHLSPRIAVLLRGLGHDALSVTERADLGGLSDERLWHVAIAESRVIVTHDVRDFLPLVGRSMATGGSHAGTILVSPRTFPPSLDGTGRLADALDLLAATTPAGLGDRVVWLEPDGR